MKLHKLFQLAYDVHTCRMIPQLVIILEGDMCTSEDITYSDDKNDVGAEADFNNLETSITVSPIPTTRIHKDHHVSQIIGDLSSTNPTRSMTRVVKDQGGLSQMFNDDFHTCMFACFLSQEEPKRVHQALKDPIWIEAMHEELLEFKMQKFWVLVDLPHGKRAIGTKWVFRNKKDERGIVVRNKARFVAQGHIQEEGINYEEVFAPVARIEAIRLVLAYASFMGFMVYQMDVKSAFLYGTIEEEFYVCQPPGFEDPNHPDKVYKVVKALYGLHQAPRAWYETLANYLLENGFLKRQDRSNTIYQEVKQKKDGIFISQDKYVAEILRKFRLTKGKSASTPIDTEKSLLKDTNGEDVDVHTYRSMIGSLMYLTSSRPDILFACKKQTVVATLSTEAEYVAAASCYAQVEKVGIGVNVVDLKVSAVMHILLLLVHTLLLFKVNDVTRLQGLVDKKKVVVIEAAIREALRLDDAEGVDCLPNEEIFTALARMGYEKPSTKLTFYKAFFSS
nr:hypothetical protein [Tanacetum cinerariifolium]